MSDNAKSVMLYLVNPPGPGERLLGGAPLIVDSIAALPVRSRVVDGEAIAVAT
jgi:hypothetical protein